MTLTVTNAHWRFKTPVKAWPLTRTTKHTGTTKRVYVGGSSLGSPTCGRELGDAPRTLGVMGHALKNETDERDAWLPVGADGEVGVLGRAL